MKENVNIDELLNSFLDGELPARQQTEVQRLVVHDSEVAKRLHELEKCKMLVGSLPFAEAPAEMRKQIKDLVEAKKLASRQVEFERREGARQLLARKVLAAAAMIALVAILGGVIYTIVAPEQVSERPVAIEDLQPVKKIEVAQLPPSTAEAKQAVMGFNGRLELKTNALAAVDGFINRSIENNGLSDYVSSRPEEQSVRRYSLVCSSEDMKILLADLGTIWQKFSSARLTVDAEESGRGVVIDDVSAEQIGEIVTRDSTKSYVDKARYFAVTNRMEELLPGKDVMAAIDEWKSDLIEIPKPVLTSSEPLKKQTQQTQAEELLYLTIIVSGSE